MEYWEENISRSLYALIVPETKTYTQSSYYERRFATDNIGPTIKAERNQYDENDYNLNTQRKPGNLDI